MTWLPVEQEDLDLWALVLFPMRHLYPLLNLSGLMEIPCNDAEEMKGQRAPSPSHRPYLWPCRPAHLWQLNKLYKWIMNVFVWWPHCTEMGNNQVHLEQRFATRTSTREAAINDRLKTVENRKKSTWRLWDNYRYQISSHMMSWRQKP